jgi:uncharacterized heparinase superfamily protein
VRAWSRRAADPRRRRAARRAEAGLVKALVTASVFEDGGSVARAPVAQLDIIMLLAMLRGL